MRVATGLIGVSFLVLVVGCSVLPWQSSLYSDYAVGELKVDKDSASVKLKQAITKKDASDTERLVDADCFNVPIDKTSGSTAARCQQQRNAAVVVLLNASDDMCQAHFKTIFGNEASFNIMSGSITNLAAGLATGIGSITAKTALSGVAFFSNAERSLVNETVYKNLLINAVTTKIREARDTKVVAIIPGNLTKDIDSYPMLMAVRDVINYHYACSFMFGLEQALKEGTQPTLESRKIKLEQERQRLALELTVKTKALKDAKRTDPEIDKDKDIVGLRDRLGALDAELVNLTKAQK